MYAPHIAIDQCTTIVFLLHMKPTGTQAVSIVIAVQGMARHSGCSNLPSTGQRKRAHVGCLSAPAAGLVDDSGGHGATPAALARAISLQWLPFKPCIVYRGIEKCEFVSLQCTRQCNAQQGPRTGTKRGWWDAYTCVASVPIHTHATNPHRFRPTPSQQAVLLLDGDFVPGPATALERLLFRPTAHADLLQGLHSQHALLVLPAFEPMRTCGSLDQQLQLAIHVVDTDSKHPLVAAYHNGSIDVFQSLYHHASDYRRWLGAEDVYEIRYVSEHPEGLQPNNVRTRGRGWSVFAST